jgi:hypothetical protein
MSLTSVDEVRALVKTPLSDADLQALIDRIEVEITRRIGPQQDDEMTVTHTVIGYGCGDTFFLPGEAAEIVSVEEDNIVLGKDEYRYYAGGALERLGARHWFGQVEVVYKPIDDRAARKQAVIDLVRLTLQRTAMKSEDVAGEYSYQAPVWDAEALLILRRMVFRGL